MENLQRLQELQAKMDRSHFDDDGTPLPDAFYAHPSAVFLHRFLQRIPGGDLSLLPTDPLALLQPDPARTATRDSFLGSPNLVVARVIHSSPGTTILQILGNTVDQEGDILATAFGPVGSIIYPPTPTALMIASQGLIPYLTTFYQVMSDPIHDQVAKDALARALGTTTTAVTGASNMSSFGSAVGRELVPFLSQMSLLNNAQSKPSTTGTSRSAWNEKMFYTIGRANEPHVVFALCYHSTRLPIPAPPPHPDPHGYPALQPGPPGVWREIIAAASLDLALAAKKLRVILDGPRNSSTASTKATDAQLLQLFLVQDFSTETASLIDLCKTGEDPTSPEAIQICLESLAAALTTIGFSAMATAVLTLRTELRKLVTRFNALRPVDQQLALVNAILSGPIYEFSDLFPNRQYATLEQTFERVFSLFITDDRVQLILFNAITPATEAPAKRPRTAHADSQSSGRKKKTRSEGASTSKGDGNGGAHSAKNTTGGKTSHDADAWKIKRQENADARPACIPASFVICRDWVRGARGCKDSTKCTAKGGPYTHDFPPNSTPTQIASIREWVADLYKG